MVKRALISVYDKTGLEKLVEALIDCGVEIISSGGTAKRIRELGYEVTEVSDYTGYPEMPGGLVKTLHPKIHAGILGDASDPKQREYMERFKIKPIDVVVVNFYPFEEASRTSTSLREAVKNIDIGGPAMVRAAAKASLLNGDTLVVTNPKQYGAVIEELERTGGQVNLNLKRKLALEAFVTTWKYDGAIKDFLIKKLGEI